MIIWAFLFFVIVLTVVLVSVASAIGAWVAWRAGRRTLAAFLAPVLPVLTGMFVAWVVSAMEAGHYAQGQTEAVDEGVFIDKLLGEFQTILFLGYVLPVIVLIALARLIRRRCNTVE